MAILAFYIGLFFLALSLVAIIKGSVENFKISSRKQGAILFVASIVWTGVAAANSPPPPESENVAARDQRSSRPSTLEVSTTTTEAESTATTTRTVTTVPTLQPSSEGTNTSSSSTTRVIRSTTSRPVASRPSYLVFQRRDVSFGSTKRLALDIEVRTWPITSDALSQVARKLVNDERPNGWHAISISARYDRREAVPAFGVFEWAPGGDWARADEGNPRTWRGYELSQNLRPKFRKNPSECVPPTEQAYVLAAEFNQVIERGDEVDEEALLRRIGARDGLSQNQTFDLIFGVDAWSNC
jgi:hypothetical protein